MTESNDKKLINADIVEEMKSAYIDYSMSVIVSRALPDIRDGFKPVHRRVLYGMHTSGMSHNKPYKKSARVVGEVMGKFHPHGDGSVYDSMARMAQPWSLRYTFVDGQGNFGSIDGDAPAAMRYTEVRMAKCAEDLLVDIDKDTVDFSPNYDGSLLEPTVLPSKIPNLLINGTSGIAVGMATNMAPHNLSEVINGIVEYINNNEISIEELMKIIKAPDFPTGGIIYGLAGVRDAFMTGRGRVVIRAKTDIEINGSKEQIVVTEIPYMVNKAAMIERTAHLVNQKIIEGISNIRDESDKDGLRIVYELKRDAISSIVLNNLFKHTQLQFSFSVNNVVLINGRPHTANLKDLIKHYVDHRHVVLVKKTKFDLEQANKKLHLLEGYLKCLDNIDEVIKLIKSSKDSQEAQSLLISKINLSEIQAKAVLEMKLHKLTGLEREKILNDFNKTKELIENLEKTLSSEDLRMQILKEEMIEIKKKYSDERRSSIELSTDEISIEDTIPNEQMVITVSNQNYIKRTSLQEYRVQARGGVGSKGAGSKDEDFVVHLFVSKTHDTLLIFTSSGKVFSKKVYSLPEGGKTSKGRALQNIIDLPSGDKVMSIIKVSSFKDTENQCIIICTKKGLVKKTSVSQFSNIRVSGIYGIKVNDGDEILDAKIVELGNEVVMATKFGKANKFTESEVRPMGRMTSGVKGISLDKKDDEVVGLEIVKDKNEKLLVVSEKGYGKQSNIEDYRQTHRGGKGVTTLNITPKTGNLVAIKSVNEQSELLVMKKSGIVIRIKVTELPTIGRSTQGVKLINLQEDEISSVANVDVIVE